MYFFKYVSIFYLRAGDQVLIKFDIQKDFASQSSYFKSRSDPMTLGGVGRGPDILKITQNRGDQDETQVLVSCNRLKQSLKNKQRADTKLSVNKYIYSRQVILIGKCGKFK